MVDGLIALVDLLIEKAKKNDGFNRIQNGFVAEISANFFFFFGMMWNGEKRVYTTSTEETSLENSLKSRV